MFRKAVVQWGKIVLEPLAFLLKENKGNKALKAMGIKLDLVKVHKLTRN